MLNDNDDANVVKLLNRNNLDSVTTSTSSGIKRIKQEEKIKELPAHIRKRLYLCKITKIQYVTSENKSYIFWVDAKKNEKISFFEGKIELKTVHDVLVFLYEKGILNPEKEWNLVV